MNLTNGGFFGGTINASNDVTISVNFDGGAGTLNITGAATRTVTLPAGAQAPGLTLNAPILTLNTSGTGTVTLNSFNLQSAASVTNGAVNFTVAVPDHGYLDLPEWTRRR